MKTIIVALFIGMAAPACAEQTAASTARHDAGVPADVAAFLARRAECLHWAGEEPYDAERRAFINKAVKKAGCARLDADRAALQRKYRDTAAVTDALAAPDDQ